MFKNLPKINDAAPFAVSLLLPLTVIIAAIFGGWTIALIPFYGIFLSSFIDRLLSDNTASLDPDTDDSHLYWHRMLTMIWLPVQIFFVFFALIAATRFDHLSTAESVWLFIATGVATGGVGVVYAHELIHQKNHLERNLGDALLAMVLYSHFRTKHILIHHRYVGTPADPVTARYNEGFHRFLFRLLPEGLIASWKLEKARLATRKLPVWDASNPFWPIRFGRWAFCLSRQRLAVGPVLGYLSFRR